MCQKKFIKSTPDHFVHHRSFGDEVRVGAEEFECCAGWLGSHRRLAGNEGFCRLIDITYICNACLESLDQKLIIDQKTSNYCDRIGQIMFENLV